MMLAWSLGHQKADEISRQDVGYDAVQESQEYEWGSEPLTKVDKCAKSEIFLVERHRRSL
jgi:hypothetical protein